MANAYSHIIRQTLTDQLDLAGFTPEEKGEILDMLEENIMMRAHIDILDALTQEKKDQFFIISEKSEPEKIEAFLKKELPHFSDIIKHAAISVVKEFTNAE